MNNVGMSLSRRGRSSVRVRIIGVHSVAWGEMASQWGATVEAIVSWGGNALKTCYQYFTELPLSDAKTLDAHGAPFYGLVLGNVRDDDDAQYVRQLVEVWRPRIAIFSVPTQWKRRVVTKLLGTTGYNRLLHIHHSDVGGVTVGSWKIYYKNCLEKAGERDPYSSVTYRRTLQTALDDTIKAPSGIAGSTDPPNNVYDSGGLGPDISALGPTKRKFWVDAKSVWSKQKVVRQVTSSELFSIWDYEGKLEAKTLGGPTMETLLRARLKSPPGKILRALGHTALESLLPVDSSSSAVEATKQATDTSDLGLTKDIPVGPLEQLVETRVEAKLPDDAPVDFSLWAAPNETPEMEAARHVLRRLAVKWWASNIEKEAREWLASHDHDERDVEAVENIVKRVKACSYWEWHRGSRLFFWRFPSEWLADARDGVEFWKFDTPPAGLYPNVPSESREAELLTRQKIFKLRYRMYLEDGPLKLVIPRFAIAKATEGEIVTDIRCIWDCKANGHNAVLWAPGFMLPGGDDAYNMVVKWLDRTIASYLEDTNPQVDYSQDESVFTKSKQWDIDVGEMFYNFATHENDRKYLGARWISTRPEGESEPEAFLRFTALPFGGRCCPFIAYQGQLRILELGEGDRHGGSNPFQWDRVHLNLPTSPDWDPSLPRVMKLRKDGELATTQAPYVDDIHGASRDTPGEPSRADASSKRLKRKMNYLGNQADERKFRKPALNPGAWRGVIVSTGSPFPMKSTTAKKWTRFKDGLTWIISSADDEGCVDTAELRRIAGLGVHLTEVYCDARCYLTGFFNALEAFREDRDVDGWRLQTAMDEAANLEDKDATRAQAAADYPRLTRVTSELSLHVQALLKMFASESPLALPVRPSHRNKFRYFIGDASAEGLGSAFQYPNLEVRGREGLWDESFAEGGSNLREAQCQVNHLLAEINAGLHDGCEVWAFSDNAIWSMVFNRGSSSARHLFKLVLDLKIACYKHEVYLHTCHISGDRMIATGMDGWSRGDYDAGISLGYDLRDFLPLDVPAFNWPDQQLETWCKGWMGSQYSPPLEPEAWYGEGHQPGVHIWAPPPAAALEALKQLSRSRTKRMNSVTHVFICPRLLYQEEWRRRFEKEMDIWFFLAHGTVWPHNCFEPLMVGLSFPLSRQYPWLLRQERSQVVEIGRSLSELSKTSHLQVGNYLRQLWVCPRSLPSVS